MEYKKDRWCVAASAVIQMLNQMWPKLQFYFTDKQSRK